MLCGKITPKIALNLSASEYLLCTKESILQCSFNFIGCSFKFLLEVGVDESIVNALLVCLQSKNTNNVKSEVRFKQLIRDLNPWCVHNRFFNTNLEDKFK
jgi:hypothetical protein